MLAKKITEELSLSCFVFDIEERVKHVLRQSILLTGLNVQKLVERFQSLETRMENKVGDLETRVENKVGDLETRVEKKIGDMETRVKHVEYHVRKHFNAFSKDQQDMAKKLAVVDQQLTHSWAADPFFFYSCCSRVINFQHREGRLEPQVQLWSENLIARLDALPPYPEVVYRGIDVSGFPDDAVLGQFCTAGSIYRDQAFTSTSLSDKVAWHFSEPERANHRVIMVIQHKSGRLIQEFVAEEYKWEEEVLFKPCTQFNVMKWENRGTCLVCYLQEI